MKESGMEKLNTLLQDYKNGLLNRYDLKEYESDWKSFKELVQRLVENNKIDLLKLTCMNPRYTEILDSDFSWEDRIIMLLSIQDNPIEFLISILK